MEEKFNLWTIGGIVVFVILLALFGWDVTIAIMSLAVVLICVRLFCKVKGWDRKSRAANRAARQAQEQQLLQREQKKQEIIRATEELTKLIDDYVGSNIRETEAAWKQHLNLMKVFDLSGNDSKDKTLHDVIRILHEMCNYNKSYEFTANLLEFYYRVAYTYHLEESDQHRLLAYFYKLKPIEVLSPYFDWSSWDARFLELLEYGCECESRLAMSYLADCYFFFCHVRGRDYDKAFTLYQQAAQLGRIYAVGQMALCYKNGWGTKKNLQKAGDCCQYGFDQGGGTWYSETLDELYTSGKWDKRKYSPDIFSYNTKKMKKDNLEELRLKLEN